jgi:hypothetical protein
MNEQEEEDISVPNPCKRPQAIVVDVAFAKATTMLRKARKLIDYYNSAPQRKENKRVSDALRKHFGWSEEIRKAGSRPSATGISRGYPEIPKLFIPQVIDRLISRIGKPKRANCALNSPTPGPSQAERNPTKVAARVFRVGTNTFSYGPSFFESSKADQARIVIHEMLHSYENTVMDDIFYVGEKGYPGTLEQASMNIDSYACFIRDVGG